MNIPPMRRELVERFWAKIAKGASTDCWEWQGAKIKGYGSMGWAEDGKPVSFLAHRISYFLEHGRQPDVCCHHCDNPGCVNPAHLFNGTHADNIRDRDRKGRGGGHKRRGQNNGRHTIPESTCRGRRWQRAHSNPETIRKKHEGRHRYFQEHPEALQGENNPRSKLTEENVREIRRAYAAHEASSLKLAARFQVSKQIVLSIIHRQSWAHVP